MNSSLSLVLFYGLLAVAAVVLRGDLGEWPRVVDRSIACLLCMAAAALLASSWKSRQPAVAPADDGSSRPRRVWPWWLAVACGFAFLFLVVLPPVSVGLARPMSVEGTEPGADSFNNATPMPPGFDGPSLPDAEGTETAAGRTGASSPAAGEAGESLTLGQRMRMLWNSRSPWLIVLLFLLLVLMGVALAWLVRRLWKPWPDGAADGGGPRPPWHRDPSAPRYVLEFRRLCEALGFAPRPGDTWRDLLARLPAMGAEAAVLEAAGEYHYRVRYEGQPSRPAEERDFVRVIRALRKAATFHPATKTTKEG